MAQHLRRLVNSVQSPREKGILIKLVNHASKNLSPESGYPTMDIKKKRIYPNDNATIVL